MFDALHPTENRIISFSEYKQYTLNQGVTVPRNAPKARCPVCKADMGARAGRTQANGHFYHLDDIFCPTKNPAERPYLGLVAENANINHVQANKEFVKNNIEKIYKRLKEIVPFFDFKEFIAILKEARKLNCYGYANLDINYIPYVYVTMINFLPKNGVKVGGNRRKFKFCFFYDANIQTYENLWINQGMIADLIRVSYDKSQTKKVTAIDTTLDYLKNTDFKLSKKQLEWCFSEM